MIKLGSCLLFLMALVSFSFPCSVTAKISPGMLQGFTLTVYNKSDRCVRVTSETQLFGYWGKQTEGNIGSGSQRKWHVSHPNLPPPCRVRAQFFENSTCSGSVLKDETKQVSLKYSSLKPSPKVDATLTGQNPPFSPGKKRPKIPYALDLRWYT